MLKALFTDFLRLRETGLHSNLFEKIEKFIIQKALSETRGNQVQAAKLLGISQNTLQHRIEKFGLCF